MGFYRALLLLALCSGWCAQAAYDTNTVALYGELNTCAVDVTSDIDCITQVKEGLESISSVIDDVHTLEGYMTKIVNGANTLSTIVKFAKYAPGIGSAINVLKTAIDIIKPTLTTVKNKLTTIDNKIYPWKARIDNATGHIDTGLTYLGYLQSTCINGRDGVELTKSCVDDLAGGSVKTSLQNALEGLGGALNSDLVSLNSAFGNVGSACASVKSLTDIALGWPNLSSILSSMASLFNFMDPILDFFASLQSALDYELCIANPFELIAEWELLEEIAEALKPSSWGWRRRRSITGEYQKIHGDKRQISNILLSRQQANSLINPVIRASSVCFSVQDILDGLDAVFSALTSLAQDVIDAVLDLLPTFSIPGLPNFTDLLNLDFSFNLPTIIDLSWDFNLYARFTGLSWDCTTQVKSACAAVSGNVVFDCSAALSTYTVSSGRKRRSADDYEYQQFEQLAALASKGRLVSRRGLNDTGYEMVEVRPPKDHARKDNKHMTEEEADRLLEGMTVEQRKKFMELLKEKKNGENVPDDAATPSYEQTTGVAMNERELAAEVATDLEQMIRRIQHDKRG